MQKTAWIVIVLGTVLTVNFVSAHPGFLLQQDAAMNHRGAMVMGFDQEKTMHHFRLYADGGSIEVTANSANDVVNRNAIRDHLPHIAEMFAGGDFDAPMEVHAQQVPGTAELAKLKDTVSYKYVELPNGGRIEIFTTNAAALRALHDFLKFQIKDHKTGDAVTVSKRHSEKQP
jgi:hypothetical protein